MGGFLQVGGASSGGTISDITSTSGTITVTNPTGPTTNIEVTTPGAMQLIQHISASSQATMTANSLGAFNHLEILFVGNSSEGASETDNLQLLVNGVSSASYQGGGLFISGTSAPANNVGAGESAVFVCRLPAATATAGSVTMARILIPNYRGTTFYKIAEIFGGWLDLQTLTTDAYMVHGPSLLQTTAAITSITLQTSSASNFGTADMWVYGIT